MNEVPWQVILIFSALFGILAIKIAILLANRIRAKQIYPLKKGTTSNVASMLTTDTKLFNR